MIFICLIESTWGMEFAKSKWDIVFIPPHSSHVDNWREISLPGLGKKPQGPSQPLT